MGASIATNVKKHNQNMTVSDMKHTLQIECVFMQNRHVDSHKTADICELANGFA